MGKQRSHHRYHLQALQHMVWGKQQFCYGLENDVQNDMANYPAMEYEIHTHSELISKLSYHFSLSLLYSVTDYPKW